MSDDTNTGARSARGDRGEVLAELGLPLEELVRRGAREILQRALEAEVEQLLEEFAGVSLMDGRRAVVRNGHLPAREILTAVGPVEIQVPKVRDRSGSGVKFNSALAPPYVRRSARVAAALPWLYLKGISSGDLGEALEVLVGEDAKGLSAAALGRLKAAWAEEYTGWAGRSLDDKQYAYWWVDGIDTTLRESDDPKLCLLVIIGVRPDGTKEWVAISDVLRDLKARGLQTGPRLAVGDGALGFWGALDQVYPETAASALLGPQDGQRAQRPAQVVAGKAKADLQASGWPRPASRPQRLQALHQTAMGPNTPRRPRSSRRIATPCSPSSPSRPSIGRTCAPPTRSSRPSPPCAIAPAGPRTASPAQPSSVWPSR
jgi:putative transposase